MTNEEGERLNDIANEYWEDFGQLVARHLTRAPQHLRDDLLALLRSGPRYTAVPMSITWRPGGEPHRRPSAHERTQGGFCVQLIGETVKTLTRCKK